MAPRSGSASGEEVVIMKLLLKDEKYSFTVTKAAEPKTEFGSGKQKMNRPANCPSGSSRSWRWTPSAGR
jgi:hypothetical protein